MNSLCECVEFLLNEHRITKAKEAILLLDSDLIRCHSLIIPIERGNQHNERALRQVEVCDQAVNGVQLDTGINKNARVATAGYDLAVAVPDGFQRAAAGCADSNNTVPGSAGVVDELCGLLAD